MSLLRITRSIAIPVCAGFLFSGCGLLLSYVFRPCNVEINERYIKASCGLTNGAYFEELLVDSMLEEGIPAKYRILSQFECSYQSDDEIRKEWPNKLYFKKTNDHYVWRADTLDQIRLAAETGYGRDLFKVDTLTGDTIAVNMGYFVFNEASYTSCPVPFKPKTWYFLSIMQPDLLGVYLYVDEHKHFHVYEQESGVSPI
ncbi:MAG TPA: hypothetical protein PK511_08460 [Chitinophagales bacterium]|nr:hypothetical protein [Chitinophagales bacterium]HNA58104.1 hypothetical protein [Chitinophagales bacterium]HNI54539.1 hypothetical protein [Chitinophagales bacterium]